MRSNTKNLTLAAMFLAMGVALPFLTGQVPQIGSMLLPMHIPVFLCAFLCSWQYSACMAFILPLLRSLVFSRPNMYPEAISIAFELLAYALIAGLIYRHSKRQSVWTVYKALIISMVAGRVIRCAVQMLLLGIKGSPISVAGVFTGVVITGIPGIIIQLLLIPAVMAAIDKYKANKKA